MVEEEATSNLGFWCAGWGVLERTEEMMVALAEIDYVGMRAGSFV